LFAATALACGVVAALLIGGGAVAVVGFLGGTVAGRAAGAGVVAGFELLAFLFTLGRAFRVFLLVVLLEFAGFDLKLLAIDS